MRLFQNIGLKMKFRINLWVQRWKFIFIKVDCQIDVWTIRCRNTNFKMVNFIMKPQVLLFSSKTGKRSSYMNFSKGIDFSISCKLFLYLNVSSLIQNSSHWHMIKVLLIMRFLNNLFCRFRRNPISWQGLSKIFNCRMWLLAKHIFILSF